MVHSAAPAQPRAGLPALQAHRRLVCAWAESGERIGWGADGGYWLRYMLLHFGGAGWMKAGPSILL